MERSPVGARARESLDRSSDHGFDHLLDSDDVDYSFDVVTQDRQAHFRAHLAQSSHQEITVTHGSLDGAERRLRELLPPPHHFRARAHSAGHVFQKLLIHPAADAPAALVRRAFRSKRTAATFAGRVIANLSPQFKALIAKGEFRSGRTAITIFRFVIDEVLLDEQAALLVHRSDRFGNVSLDAGLSTLLHL